jgi:tRNA/rRNA methyltransferase
VSLDRARIVLVRPKSAGNVGAVARVMKNFGLSDLRLVAPGRVRESRAVVRSVHAADVLATAKRHAKLAEAVADCAWVIGTTCRPGSYRKRPLTPREAAAELLSVCDGNQAALVFGPEDHGLSNEDLKVCHELVTIPTHSGYSSLNLAHAVGVCCYELFLARHSTRGPSPALATSDRLQRLYDSLGRALLRIGFLHGANPDHIMFTLRRVFGRARLDVRETAIWTGIARQIEWFADGGREVAEEKRRRGARLK